MITYREITKETEKDLQIPNEPFDVYGQLIVTREKNQWSHKIQLSDQVETMTFPDEDYTFAIIDKKGFALGAYDGEECIGLAVYEYNWNKYLYLMDLKVNSDYRKRGIAGQLINEGQNKADKLNYQGIYTVTQDNNLSACQFYLKTGFVIGGLNTMDYRYTTQEGKADIYLYLDNK